MFGIELPDLIRFFMQAGSGVAGASALWGLLFLYRRGEAKGGERDSWLILTKIVFWVHISGLFVFLGSRYLITSFFYAQVAEAHEGIVLPTLPSYFANGLVFTDLAATFIALLGFVFFIIAVKKQELFPKYAKVFFLLLLILISFHLCFITFTGELGREQLFYSFHNWHSILTLGTVITIDVLFIATIVKDNLKRVLYPFFPIMSAAIWVGLGLDFASVTLIFPEAIRITQQFLFNQTVIAIIIINGALLSGKINDILISLIETGRVRDIPKNVSLIFEVSGSVSIVSWLTITFIDFFELDLSYAQMFFGYILVIFCAFLTQRLTKNYILYKKSL